jgi:MFS family permease
LFFFWMHYYFEDVLHLGASRSRRYATILTLAMAAGMVLGGWIADRLRAMTGGRRHYATVPVSGMCLGAVLLVLGILVQDVFWIVTLLALALAAVGASEAPIWTLATELGGRRGGTAAAICNTGGNAGGLIAPIVTPWASGWISRQAGLAETTGWQLGISLGSAVAIGGAVLWFWITPDAGAAPPTKRDAASAAVFD